MTRVRVPVRLGERGYDIWIAHDHYQGLGRALRRLGIGETAFVVTRDPIFRKHGRDLRRTLTRSGIAVHISKHFQADERAKSQDSVRKLIRELVAVEGLRQRVFLICFAGGVLGDLTGFAAAIYKRGIPYVQVPTTLLAQVDSAIGGKTAVDLPEGKNLLGAIYQPRLVYSEISTLERLPIETLRDGLAEAIKYGVILSGSFFQWIEKEHRRLLARDPKVLQKVVETCSRMKARVVAQDEYDREGKRVILNYGHTLGHALEQVAGYRARHGGAISVGMLLAAEIAEGLGLFHKRETGRLETLLKKVGLPTRIPQVAPHRRWSLEAILRAEGHDKKFIHGKNRYVLPVTIGKVVVKEGIPYSLIRHVIQKRLS